MSKSIIVKRKDSDYRGRVITGAKLVRCFIGGHGETKLDDVAKAALESAEVVEKISGKLLIWDGVVATLPEIDEVDHLCKLSADGKKYLSVDNGSDYIVDSASASFFRNAEEDVEGYFAWGESDGLVFTESETPSASAKLYEVGEEAMVELETTIASFHTKFEWVEF